MTTRDDKRNKIIPQGQSECKKNVRDQTCNFDQTTGTISIIYSPTIFRLKSHNTLISQPPITTMAPTVNLNQIFSTFPSIPKLSGDGKPRQDLVASRFTGNNADETQNHLLKPTRRLALGLGSIGLFANSNISVALAEDNGFWLNGPIPIPRALNSNFLVSFYQSLPHLF